MLPIRILVATILVAITAVSCNSDRNDLKTSLFAFPDIRYWEPVIVRNDLMGPSNDWFGQGINIIKIVARDISKNPFSQHVNLRPLPAKSQSIIITDFSDKLHDANESLGAAWTSRDRRGMLLYDRQRLPVGLLKVDFKAGIYSIIFDITIASNGLILPRETIIDHRVSYRETVVIGGIAIKGEADYEETASLNAPSPFNPGMYRQLDCRSQFGRTVMIGDAYGLLYELMGGVNWGDIEDWYMR